MNAKKSRKKWKVIYMKKRAFEELFLKHGTMYIGDAIPTPKYRRPVPPPPPISKERLTAIPDIDYESPIKVCQEEIKILMEDDVCKIVQKHGVDVDKDELIKALRRERQQYENGFKDGIKKFAEKHKEIMREFLWEDSTDFLMKWCEYEVNTDSLAKELVGEYNETDIK